MKRATIREVAKQAGVSVMTVSRVINGKARVNETTRHRVETAIAELDYIPNSLARGLTSRRTGTLGLIVPDVINPFFSLVIRGAEAVARRAGYRLLLCNTEGDLELERDYIGDMVSHQVEGLLIAPVSDRSKPQLRTLLRREFPFVLIDRSVSGLDCDLVQADGIGGARQLIEHLLKIGHRRIAMITEKEEVSTARERRRGYQEALENAGIPYSAEMVIETSVDARGGYQAMQRILQLEPRPDAVFAVNNMTALGAGQLLREQGLVVPDDIALVCFDDVEHLAILSPFLTVMDQPAETFGTLAVQVLLERIAGRGGDRYRRVVLPADLIVRESCGAKAAGIPVL
jgi:LacI family transcriptional regulator